MLKNKYLHCKAFLMSWTNPVLYESSLLKQILTILLLSLYSPFYSFPNAQCKAWVAHVALYFVSSATVNLRHSESLNFDTDDYTIILKLNQFPFRKKEIYSQIQALLYSTELTLQHGFNAAINELIQVPEAPPRHVTNSLTKPNRQYLALLGGYLRPTNS